MRYATYLKYFVYGSLIGVVLGVGHTWHDHVIKERQINREDIWAQVAAEYYHDKIQARVQFVIDSLKLATPVCLDGRLEWWIPSQTNPPWVDPHTKE